MKVLSALFAALLLGACATNDPFDLSAMQRQLDDRGMGFGVTRVPGHDAFVFQVRFTGSDTGAELNTLSHGRRPSRCAGGLYDRWRHAVGGRRILPGRVFMLGPTR